jgi:hypothetical protein
MTVSCRVTQAEWHYLDGLARKHGRSLNDLLRFLLLAGMPQPKSPASAEETS